MIRNSARIYDQSPAHQYMKSSILILFITFSISTYSFSQNSGTETDRYTYFDENYDPISKTDFYKRLWEKELFSVQGDSSHHKILTSRGVHGKLESRTYLDSLLSASTTKTIDSTKALVIIYYPGKDACNSSGSSTRVSTRRWYNEMERKIRQLRSSNIIYVYKTEDGLYGRHDGYKEWIKDPGETIEKLFFKRHYPCSSFVVISKDGEYISCFGEFGKENVWKLTRKMKK